MYYMTMRNYLTNKEAEKYREDILWFSLRFLHIEKEVYEIYKSHRRMSKFLHYFDIFHLFTDEFTKYWLDYFGEIASKKEIMKLHIERLRSLLRDSAPITEGSPNEVKNIFVMYYAYCRLYRQYSSLEKDIENNNWKILEDLYKNDD